MGKDTQHRGPQVAHLLLVEDDVDERWRLRLQCLNERRFDFRGLFHVLAMGTECLGKFVPLDLGLEFVDVLLIIVLVEVLLGGSVGPSIVVRQRDDDGGVLTDSSLKFDGIET